MSDESLVVKCSLGNLQGSVYKTGDGESIYAFQGVPYGQPPTGDLRFKDPVPVEPWTCLKPAINPPPKALCLAMSPTGEITLTPDHSEDCLYLNIYTPNIPNPKLNLPVMVYFHGGGFTYGTGNAESCGPDYLVPNGVILVTVNYRLGAFGFLSLQTPECPGNYGLKDQSLSLLWVKTNISAFGGDPSNVTIFGESAGSASVHYHMISKLSRGLFQRVIAQSGTATNRWALSRHPKKSACVLAEKISGESVTSSDVALEILKNASAKDILLHSETVFADVEGLWAGEHICKFAFVPTVEPVGTANPFLEKHPQQALDDGDSVDVPIITGVCSHEGIFVLPGADYVPDENNQTDFEKILPKETGLALGSDAAAAAAQKLKKFYFPNGVNQDDYIRVMSDTLVTYDVAKHAYRFAGSKKSPLYFYVFSAGREPSAIKKIFQLENVEGTSHADDLEYLFTTNGVPTENPIVKGSTEDNIKNLLTKIWTDFAKNGKVPAEWKPVKLPDKDYVEITDKIEPKKGFYSDIVQFWDDIYTLLSKTN